MSMMWLNFKMLLVGISLLYTFPLTAQSTIVDIGPKDTLYNSDYQYRLDKYQRQWNRLIPMHTVFQYAGGMGLISVGAGWTYGKNKQWETDVLFGYIPKYSSDKIKITMTLKQNYIPWRVPLKHNWTLEPLECGLYFNTVFSDEFWTSEPDRYPKGYYGFSTRVRTHIFVGQRIRMNIPEKYRKLAKSITAFYEISSYDLYIVSAFTNHLKLDDYLRLSFGLKFQIF